MRDSDESAGAVARILRENRWFMEVLHTVADVAPPDWAVGGGVIRTLVWDRLSGYTDPTPLADVDVPYFDASDTRRAQEREYERRLAGRLRDVPWDVKNQAAVHLWYADVYGHEISPVRSISDAIGRFPETATSVAVRFDDVGGLEIIAPCGLDDLLALRLRRNPAQVTEAYFRDRIRSKRIERTWPDVELILD